jgi:general secretion pathway protein F
MTLRFRYEAVAATGVLERGEVSALTHGDAKRSLTDRGLLPTRLDEISVMVQRSTMPVADLAVGLRIMADLLDAGLSAGRMLRTFEELAPPGWRPVLPSLQESVKQGSSLATALANTTVSFPPVVLGIAQAGEAGQGMGAAIRRAAELMERAAATRAAIRSALAYPIVLAIAGLLALGVLLGVVLPQFAIILADLGQSLPPATRLVLSLSKFFQTTSIPIAGSLAVSFVAWRAWLATENGRKSWADMLLSFPVIGPLRFSMASSRAAHTLSALLATGVPIASGMRYAAAAAGDAAIEARILSARARVIEGASLSRSAGEMNAFTPATGRLVRSGEESGKLSEMLEHAARMEQDQSDRTIQTLVKLLEPVLVFAFAGVVALVAAALLQAVYSVRPTA